MKHRLITILLIITLLTSVGIGSVCAEGLRGNTIENDIFAWELEEDGTYASNLSTDPNEAQIKKITASLKPDLSKELLTGIKKVNKLGYYLISLKLPKGYKSPLAAIVAGKEITATFHNRDSSKTHSILTYP